MNTVRLVGSRWTGRLLWLLFALLLLIVVISAYHLWRADSVTEAVRAARAGEPLTSGAGVPEKVARAVWLSTQDESEKALLIYQDIESAGQGDEATWIAKYNSANQYMRDARRLMQTESAGRAVPLIELAKQTYRSLLIQNPDDWKVRYNLARALSLLPDPPPEEEASGPAPDAQRAITTMRGYSPGMP